MVSRRTGRPNTPSENANIAPAAGLAVVEAALAYLAEPDGRDDGRDWTHFVEPLENSRAELQAMNLSYATNENVHPDDIDAFRRADRAAENVRLQTRADDVKVRIGARLEEFRSFWHSAAKGV